MSPRYWQSAILAASMVLSACPAGRAPNALDCTAPGEAYRAKYVIKSSTCWEGGASEVILSGTIPRDDEHLQSDVEMLRGQPRRFEVSAHRNWHGCAVNVKDVETGVTCELSSAPLGLDGEPYGPCVKEDGEPAGCKFHMGWSFPPSENPEPQTPVSASEEDTPHSESDAE